MGSATLGVSGAMLAVLLSGCGETVFETQASEFLDIEDTWVDPNEPDPWSAVPATDGEEGPGRTPFGCKLASGIANDDHTRFSYAGLAKLAKSVGVKCGLNLVKVVALAGAESGRYQYAYLQNKNCDYDRGLWQINSHWWEEYSSFDPTENAVGMYEISDHGTDWTPWVAYTNGNYKQFWNSACYAVKQLCGHSYC